MKKKASSTNEFDRRFDDGEDIHDLIDLSKAKVERLGQRIQFTVDVPESLARDIGEIGERIGVDTPSLIRVWLYERVRQEKITAAG